MLTAEDIVARRDWLGSSDMAALLRCDPWGSALKVYASKVHDVVESDDMGEPVDLGNDYEIPNLKWAARKLGGVEIELNVRTVGEDPLFRSTHDALIVGRPEGMEAKVRMEFRDGEFGEEGTDQVPPRVIVQAQHQCYTGSERYPGGLERVWVPIMLPYRGRLARRLYKVERSEKLIQAILEVGRKFWHDHVLPRVPPPAELGSVEVEIFKRVEREIGRIARVPAELVSTWEAGKAAEKAAERAKDLAFANLLAAVGDAEGWEWDGSDGKYYTYSEYPRTGVDREVVELLLGRLDANIRRLPLDAQALVLEGIANPSPADPEELPTGLDSVEILKHTTYRKPYLRKPETKKKRK